MLFDEVKRFLESRSGQQRELLEDWYALLAETGFVDANKILDMLLSGEIQRPDYFDVGRLAGIIMREARALAANRSKRLRYGQEQSFRCVICRDTGLVSVWNPQFVEAYREMFAEVSREAIDRDEPKPKSHFRMVFNLDRFDPEQTILTHRYTPADWMGQAAKWWRGTGEEQGPIHHLVRCNCDGDRSRTLLAERERYTRHERRFGTKELGIPACGMADYNPRVMPLKTQRPFDDLKAWYKGHEANQVYEWTPNASDYSQFR